MEPLAKSPIDPGRFVLEMLLRLRGVDIAADDLRDRVGRRRTEAADMLRCAAEFGLKGRVLTSDWERLAALPLPAIAALHGSDFLLVGKVVGDKAIVLLPHADRPRLMTRTEFEPLWDGRIILINKPGSLGNLLRRVRTQALDTAWLRVFRRDARSDETTAGTGIVPAGADGGGTPIIDFIDRARKAGRAISLRNVTDERRRADELAFLPAALEIVETPPSPLGRTVAFSIIGVFALGLVWAAVGTVDIVAIAPGKIIPSGRTKIIQPFETGVVRAIHVLDGQSVKAGDALIDLDATMTEAELAHLKSDLMASRLVAARLRAALAGKSDPLTAFVPPNDASADLVQMQRRFLVSQAAEQSAKLAAIDRQVAQKQAERATIKASIDKLQATIAPLQQRVEIRQQLFQKELGSKLTYLSEYQELVAQQQDVLVQQSRYDETDAAVAALKETRGRTVAEFERGLLEDLDKAEQKAAGLKQDVIKAEQRTTLQRLTAPVNGVVQQLAIHTVGGVVTPAQTLLLIVPAESRLEIEAMISNRDIGFVEGGQQAAIKVDTFNFTRYGLLHGKILSVSRDAIARDKPQESASDKTRGTETGSSEPWNQELVYSARISMDRTQMEIDDKRVNLAPGMAVSVEVKTGTRTILSYLLSPIARYRHDSLRER